MTSPDEIMGMLAQAPNAPATETSSENQPDNLKKLLLTKDQLDQVKTKLDGMIDTMAENPSLFSRASKYWGAIPLWQKILGGIILLVPALVIGIVFNIHLLIAVSIFSLISYAASSLILDNHAGHMTDTTSGLKKVFLA